MSGLAAPQALDSGTKTRLLRAIVVFAVVGTAVYLRAALWAGADRTVAALARLGGGMHGHIFSATLLGAASMITAGLGAMETAMVVQLAGQRVESDDAVALAIATRLSTLWCSIFLGLLALATSIRPTPQRPAPAAIN